MKQFRLWLALGKADLQPKLFRVGQPMRVRSLIVHSLTYAIPPEP